jgi:hypothetical protein
MRKLSLHLLSLFAAVSMFTMTSCTSEEDVVDPVPTVTIPNTAVSSAKVGDKVAFNVSIVAQAKIKSIETRLGTTTLGTVKTSDFTNSTSDSYPFEYTVQPADAGKTLQFAFIVTDSKERTAKTDYTLTINATGSVRTQEAKILAGQKDLTKGSFYATEGTGTIYMSADATNNSAKVDFAYYYNATNKATLAAPSNASAWTIYPGMEKWTTKNATKFKLTALTTADFNAATFESINTTVDGLTATDATDLTQGKVIAFTTQSGKKGLFLVNSVTTGDTGSINITVKIADANAI